MRISVQTCVSRTRVAIFSMLAAATLLFGSDPAAAHCDRMDGPVAQAALRALENGRFESIEIWVGEAQTPALRKAFERSRAARGEGPEARNLADRYFVESAVRLHREAEGMPYTGVRPAGQPLPPDLELAEEALDSGEVEPLIRMLQDELAAEVRRWHEAAMQARSGREKSVEAGRRWVDAYVEYIVYVHQLHQKIQAPPAHGVGSPSTSDPEAR